MKERESERQREVVYFNKHRREVKRGRREMKESFKFHIPTWKPLWKYQCLSKEK